MSNLETNQTQPSESHQFKKELGLFDATMMVVGSMIGSGIFIVSADIARNLGSPGYLLAIWLVAGVLTLIGALSYGELAAMMPGAGGQYVYLREAYNPLIGFLFGWTLFMVIQTGSNAAIAMGFAKFTGELIPVLSDNNILISISSWNVSASQILAIAVVILLSYINIRGVREGKMVQNIFTITKIAALLGVILLGIWIGKNAAAISANFSNFWGASTASVENGVFSRENISGIRLLTIFGMAMVGALFAYDGWTNITFIGGEVIRPKRNIPWSLTLGALAVICVYMLANFVYIITLPVNGVPKGNPWFKIDTATQVVESLNDKKISSQLVQLFEKNGNVLSPKAFVTIREADKEWMIQDNEKEYCLARDKNYESIVHVCHPTNVQSRGIQYASNDRVGTASATMVMGTPAAICMALCIMIATFGACNGSILAGARVYYSMAKDGLFFQGVGVLNHKGVPAIALIVQAVWASLLCLSGKYGDLLDYVIFAQVLFYILTVAGVFILRKKRPDAERPYRAFGYPVLPALYILLASALCIDLLIYKPLYTWPGLCIVLLGIPVYFVWRKLVIASQTNPLDENLESS